MDRIGLGAGPGTSTGAGRRLSAVLAAVLACVLAACSDDVGDGSPSSADNPPPVRGDVVPANRFAEDFPALASLDSADVWVACQQWDGRRDTIALGLLTEWESEERVAVYTSPTHIQGLAMARTLGSGDAGGAGDVLQVVWSEQVADGWALRGALVSPAEHDPGTGAGTGADPDADPEAPRDLASSVVSPPLQAPSPQMGTQSAGHSADDSPSSQLPSPQTAPQSSGQLAVPSSPLQAPSPQTPQTPWRQTPLPPRPKRRSRRPKRRSRCPKRRCGTRAHSGFAGCSKGANKERRRYRSRSRLWTCSHNSSDPSDATP